MRTSSPWLTMQPAMSTAASAEASHANAISLLRRSHPVAPIAASRTGIHIQRRYNPEKQTMKVSR